MLADCQLAVREQSIEFSEVGQHRVVRVELFVEVVPEFGFPNPGQAISLSVVERRLSLSMGTVSFHRKMKHSGNGLGRGGRGGIGGIGGPFPQPPSSLGTMAFSSPDAPLSSRPGRPRRKPRATGRSTQLVDN